MLFSKNLPFDVFRSSALSSLYSFSRFFKVLERPIKDVSFASICFSPVFNSLLNLSISTLLAANCFLASSNVSANSAYPSAPSLGASLIALESALFAFIRSLIVFAFLESACSLIVSNKISSAIFVFFYKNTKFYYDMVIYKINGIKFNPIRYIFELACVFVYIFTVMEKHRNISNIVSIVKGMASLPLFIEKQQAQNLLMRYDSMYQSGAFEGMIAAKENPIQVQFYNASTNISYGKFAADFTKVEKGSIAVVPVMGAMMRDSYCTFSDGFVSGTRDLEATVKALDENENVDGIVFYINSPGGQADGNESLSRVIASTKTPTVGFFEGMASAAVYAFQGVKELYAAETQSYWGSIGTYISISDDRKFWEAMGVNYLEIYAPQSTEKNIEFREAIDGNTEPMKQMLSNLTDGFIKSVKKARPSLQDDGHVFKGKLYSAVDALKIGAIDGIKNLEFAIDRARILGKKAKKQNVNTNQNTDIMSDENQEQLGFFQKWFGKSSAKEADTELETVKNAGAELQTKFEALEKEFESQKEIINFLNGQLTEADLLSKSNEAKATEFQNALNAQNEIIKASGFESIESLLEDHAKLIQHNKELGGSGNTQTPINEQQTVAATNENKPLTYEDTAAKAKASLDAKKKSK